MNILIIDDEERSIAAVREFAKQLGTLTVHCARTEGEAMHLLLNRTGVRIDIAICHHVPGRIDPFAVMEKIKAAPHLSSLTFVVLRDFSFPPLQKQWWRFRFPRLDGVLTKPFAINEFKKIIDSATSRRLRQRNTVVYVGNREAAKENLARYIAKSGSGHWTKLICIDSAQAWRQHRDELLNHAGVLLVDSNAYTSFAKNWMSAFFKSVHRYCIAVSLTKDPKEGFAVRHLCHRFVDPPANSSEWKKLLEQTAFDLRSQARWRNLRHHFRRSAELGDGVGMRSAAKQMRQSAKGSSASVVTDTMLEWYASAGNIEKCQHYFFKSIDQDPFSPHPYWVLIQTLGNSTAIDIGFTKGKCLAARFPKQAKLTEAWEQLGAYAMVAKK